MATLQIPVTKAKGMIAVNTEELPDDVYQEIMIQGLKVLLNRGASKITAASIPDKAAREAEAMHIAEKQLELVYTGKIKFSGSKAKKASGAVMTEARRIAKALVKDAIKANGEKVSHYASSDITKAANALLDTEQGKDILAEAEKNLAERSKTPIAINVSALIKPSEKLVKKAEAEKAAKKTQLSAKQAGKPQTRQRPTQQVNA